MKSRMRLIQRRRPLTRFRQRIRIHWSTFVITALALNIFFLTYAYFNLGVPQKAYATVMSAVTNGDWTKASTWSLGRVPQSYDTLTIPLGITVNVDVVTQEYADMKINVFGTLHFDGGKKIRMCDGIVDVKAGATLVGENHGSKVDICSVPVWTGDTIAIGPLVITGPTPLPVELVYFKANPEDKDVVIQWETASQVNCDYFSVERSSNGLDFSSIINIEGQGNSSQTDIYNYTDGTALEGTSYYRLKQVDLDGASQTFKTVPVYIKPGPDVIVYPNPVTTGGIATVEIPLEDINGAVEVSMVNLEGKKIFSKIFAKNTATHNSISFQTGAFPSKGTFLLIVAAPDSKKVKKIMVM